MKNSLGMQKKNVFHIRRDHISIIINDEFMEYSWYLFDRIKWVDSIEKSFSENFISIMHALIIKCKLKSHLSPNEDAAEIESVWSNFAY